MNADEITARFARLPKPDRAEVVSIDPLVANMSLGLVGDGAPALFLLLDDARLESSLRSGRALELVVSEKFRVLRAGSFHDESGYLIVLRDASKLWCFAAFAAHLADALAQEPKAFADFRRADAYLAAWTEFFDRNGLTAEESTGLWGELLVLSQFRDVDIGVARWTGPHGEAADFIGRGSRLEVKTSVGTTVAWFSLDQLETHRSDHSVFLLLTQDNKRGQSVNELAQAIRSRLRSTVAFDRLLAMVGYDPATAVPTRYRVEQTIVLRNKDIPRPAREDARILRIRFSVDVGLLRGRFLALDRVIARLER